MPPIGKLTGNVNFTDLFINLNPWKGDFASLADAQKAGASLIAYGQFINVIINFIIVAAAIFAMIKLMNALKKKEETAPAVPTPPSAQEKLLTEIRDILSTKKV